MSIINITNVNGVFSKITLVSVFAYSRAHLEKRFWRNRFGSKLLTTMLRTPLKQLTNIQDDQNMQENNFFLKLGNDSKSLQLLYLW